MKILLAAMICLFLIYPKTGAECAYRDEILQSKVMIHGYVTNTTRNLAGITIELGGDHSAVTNIDENGYYCFGYYNPPVTLYLIPHSTNHTFSPVDDIRVNFNDDWRRDFQATNTAPGHIIDGYITNISDFTGITVELGGEFDPPLVAEVDTNGYYSFENLDDGQYHLTPKSTSYTFSPESFSPPHPTSGNVRKDFSAHPPETVFVDSFTIGGLEVEGSGIVKDGSVYTGSGSMVLANYIHFEGTFVANTDIAEPTLDLSGKIYLKVNNKEIFTTTIEAETITFPGIDLSEITIFNFENDEGEGKKLKFLGLTLEVLALKAQLDGAQIESFTFQGAMVLAKDLLDDDSDDPASEVKLDFTGDNFVLYRPTGSPKWDVIGSVSFSSADGIGLKGIAELNSGEFAFDTINDKYDIAANLSIGKMVGDIEGNVGFQSGKLNSLGIGVSGLNKPLGTTGFFFQSIYAGLENVCYFTKTCNEPAILSLTNTGISGGPKFNVPFSSGEAHLVQLILGGYYSFAGELGGFADVTLLTDDFQMASAEFLVRDSFVFLSGELSLVDILTARGALKYDGEANNSEGKLEGSFSGRIEINKQWPIIGPILGGEGFNAGMYMNEKYIAAGVDYTQCLNIKIPYTPIKTKVCTQLFSGSISHNHGDPYGASYWDVEWGMDKVKEVNVNPMLYRLMSQSVAGSFMGAFSASQVARNFTVDDSSKEVVARIIYTGSAPTQVTLSAPSGDLYTATNEENGILFFPGPDSSEYLVHIMRPEMGNWSISFDDSNMLEYTIEIYGPNQSPIVSLDVPNEPVTLNDESLAVSVSLSDTEPLTVSFYLDTDLKGQDGTFITSYADISGDLSTHLEMPSNLIAGEYFLYARVEDGKNIPVVDYSPAKITWVSTSTIASIQNLSVNTESDGLRVSFEPIRTTTIEAYEIFYSDGNQEEVVSILPSDSNLLLTQVVAGKFYTIQVAALGVNGARSLRSEPVGIHYAPQGVNQAPTIVSPNPSAPKVGEEFRLQLHATDPEGQGINFSLLSYPTGMSINGSGLITWTPTSLQIGMHLITVEVGDSAGAVSRLNFELLVYSEKVANRPPAIGQSQISTSLIMGESLSLTLPVTDPEGEELTIELNPLVSGMSINTENKTISFLPQESGQFNVEAIISDGELQDSLLVAIKVIPRSPSCNLVVPQGDLQLGQRLEFTINANEGTSPYWYRFDFDGDGVFDSQFSENSTTSTTFTTGGGALQIFGEVKDTNGLVGRCSQSILLADSAGDYPPVIFATVIPPIVAPSQEAIVSLTGTYDDKDAFETLQVLWSYSSSSDGDFTTGDSVRAISFVTPGNYPISVEVKDSGGKISVKQLSLRVENISLKNQSISSATENSNFSHQFGATGGTLPHSFHVVEGSLPEGLTLSPNLGTLSGIPTTSGSFAFTVRVTDSTVPNLVETFSLNMDVNSSYQDNSTSMSIVLTSGWNLLSIPFKSFTADINTLLADHLTRVRSIWRLNNGQWSVYLPSWMSPTQKSTITAPRFESISSAEGYFVLLSEGENISLELRGELLGIGDYSPKSNFSLIGVGETVDAAEFLGVYSKTTLWTYRQGEWYVRQGSLSIEDLRDLYGSDVQYLQNLVPGEGYFIQ